MKEITIVYGQTEASPGCTQTTTDDTLERRVTTVGRVLPYVEAKIADPETGETLPPNTPGEFLARGSNVMKGYYKMPEATAQAIDKDGWLHTGDLASMDEEGYFKITGRIKDMIIRGGENIYPKEIEDFLYTHESVSDLQVIAIPVSYTHLKFNIAGDRIKETRKLVDLSQAKLAAKMQLKGISITQKSISRLEKGERLSLIHI